MESPGRKSRCEAMRGKKCSGRWSPKCYCTKGGKEGPKAAAAAAAAPKRMPEATKKLSSLATIVANLPDVYDVDYEQSEKKIARKLYGSKLKLLTPTVISKYLKQGQRFYGLSGQGWSGVETKQDKKKNIELLTYVGSIYSSGEQEAVINFPGLGVFECQLATTSSGKDFFGTGSGSDPIFIFID